MNTENLKLILDALPKLGAVVKDVVLTLAGVWIALGQSQQGRQLDKLEVSAATSAAQLPKIKVAADNAALFARSADVSAQEVVDSVEEAMKPDASF